jgi:hypothetical protein
MEVWKKETFVLIGELEGSTRLYVYYPIDIITTTSPRTAKRKSCVCKAFQQTEIENETEHEMWWRTWGAATETRGCKNKEQEVKHKYQRREGG